MPEASLLSNHTSPTTTTIESNSSPKVTTAISSLLDGYGSSSSEKDDEETETANTSQELKKNHDVVTTAVAKESSCTPTSEQQISGANAASTNYRTKLCRYFARNGTCRNGDMCTFSHELSKNNSNNNQDIGDNKKRRGDIRDRPISKRKRPTNSTLLEKLLANDRQRETILTLQLLDYIVETEFLTKRDST